MVSVISYVYTHPLHCYNWDKYGKHPSLHQCIEVWGNMATSPAGTAPTQWSMLRYRACMLHEWLAGYDRHDSCRSLATQKPETHTVHTCMHMLSEMDQLTCTTVVTVAGAGCCTTTVVFVEVIYIHAECTVSMHSYMQCTHNWHNVDVAKPYKEACSYKKENCYSGFLHGHYAIVI